jgi:4-amino-4-deoxychorismate lyase
MSSESESTIEEGDLSSFDGESVEDFGSFKYDETTDALELVKHGFECYDDEKNDFEIICSMRYSPLKKAEEIMEENFFLFKTQWQRFKYTLAFFKWDVDLPRQHLFQELKKTVEELDPSKPYKMRVAINHDKSLKVQAFEVPPKTNLFFGLQLMPEKFSKSSETYRVYLDSKSSVVGPFTSFKTTRRSVYSEARERKLNDPEDKDPRPKEVVLFNARDEATEGSITNIAFKRDGRWITPALTSGCLCGVVRHFLISKGILYQGNIFRHTIQPGEPVLLFNGVIGVCPGIIVDPQPEPTKQPEKTETEPSKTQADKCSESQSS